MKPKNVQLQKRPRELNNRLKLTREQESKEKRPRKLNVLQRKKDKTSLPPS